MHPVVIHGGGKSINEAMKKAGLEAQFVQGRRYTDERTLHIAEHVLVNEVNKAIVDEISRLEHKAMPLHSLSSCVVFGKRLFLEGQGDAKGRKIDIGMVGEVEWVNAAMIKALVEAEFIPVIAPIARDAAGGKLNINADTVAGHVAAKIKAEKLILVSDTPGIRTGPEADSYASHVTREQIDKAIAKYADTETLYDQPEVDGKKARITGPFTVEAVPAAVFGQPEVRRIEPIEWEAQKALPGLEQAEFLQPDASIAREGQTLRQSEWRGELLKTGIRAKGGAKVEFVRVEALPGTRWLSADAETKESKPRRAVISFGPEHAPLEQRQVEAAIEEAHKLVPKPALVIFAALQFDPEAAKDIDETNWPGVTLLKAQMNGDLVTEDLKKKRSSNESFWLIGQPDISIQQVKKGEHKGKHQIEVHGFDYYNPKSGKVESGSPGNIAMWMLDPDYDGRSVYPRQVFFPMSGPKDGWTRLAKNLKAEIDAELIERYRGTVSLPFERGKHGRAAVKIVDDRGIESLRIVEVPGG